MKNRDDYVYQDTGYPTGFRIHPYVLVTAVAVWVIAGIIIIQWAGL